ncbi:MAG TPA: hypothetical protein VNH41_05135 [Steroidobacteraceae bacterium]|nr:hypothetical protein [Steroidobacteraceae bacterium]
MPFLALIPARVWAELGGAIALLLLFAGYTVHERRLGAQHELQAVMDASANTEAKARASIDAIAKQYQTALQQTQESYNAQIAQGNAVADDLTQRLRHYQATHGSCPVLPSPAAPASGAAPTTGSVESAIEQLIHAAEHDLAVINAERAERDLLTGK